MHAADYFCSTWNLSNQIIIISSSFISLWDIPKESSKDILTKPTVSYEKPNDLLKNIDCVVFHDNYIIVRSIQSKTIQTFSLSTHEIINTYIYGHHYDSFPLAVHDDCDLLIIPANREKSVLALSLPSLTEFPLEIPVFHGLALCIDYSYDEYNYFNNIEQDQYY